MNFIELYYILSLLLYMYMYSIYYYYHASLLSLLLKLYVLVYHKTFMCMNINK